jgi:hypothetical protein
VFWRCVQSNHRGKANLWEGPLTSVLLKNSEGSAGDEAYFNTNKLAARRRPL